ncbi:hypothetical protein [Bacteroides caecigallinarum]|uniref:hypothetical protein n=1 Tax=Bacteroides caecigallinarum TaxID=1411144 RepID=UPI001F31EC6D|nr:hypothetical protein [Bacteroides caecigallinarum]MCF2736981.1 hypothetical protein [Bacteroides caecigallinarum]
MYEARQNKEKVSRRIDGNVNGARQRIALTYKKYIKSVCPIQKVSLANGTINCPSFGDKASIGTRIHGFIENNYIAWGSAGSGNIRVSEVLVPTGHHPDIEIKKVSSNKIIRFGEIKPEGCEADGRQQINEVSTDESNQLTLQDQINAPAWAAQVHIPIEQIDKRGYTTNGTNKISLRQDNQMHGLYIYHG